MLDRFGTSIGSGSSRSDRRRIEGLLVLGKFAINSNLVWIEQRWGLLKVVTACPPINPTNLVEHFLDGALSIGTTVISPTKIPVRALDYEFNLLY
jgi:hypothetical protein